MTDTGDSFKPSPSRSAPPADPENTPTLTLGQKVKLSAAEVLARAAVYGPLGWAAVTLVGPVSLIPLALSAGEPWVGEWVAKAGDRLQTKFPKVMAPITKVLSNYAGQQWWKHAGVLVAALAVAVVPAPALLHVLPSGVTDLLGGTSAIWSTAVNAALLTGLPLATKLATDGFQGLFERIPGLKWAADLHHRAVSAPAAARAARHRARGLAPSTLELRGVPVSSAVNTITDGKRPKLGSPAQPHVPAVLPLPPPMATLPALPSVPASPGRPGGPPDMGGVG